MPRFDFDPSKVSTTIEVWDTGRYEVVGREPKTFTRSKDGQAERAGLRFTVVRDDGKAQFIECNFMDEYGQPQAKQLAMAAYGFMPRNAQSEKQFDVFATENNIDFGLDTNPEAPYIGEGWMKIKGTRIAVNFGVTISKDGSGQQFQKFVSAEAITV